MYKQLVYIYELLLLVVSILASAAGASPLLDCANLLDHETAVSAQRHAATLFAAGEVED